MKVRRFLVLLVAALLIAAVAWWVLCWHQVQAASSNSTAATYTHGVLHVTIAYKAPHQGSGRLIVEVLNPEDQAIGRAEQHVDAGEGTGVWQGEIKLAKAIALDDLVWHRVRYRFTYDDQKEAAVEGIESISRILRRPVLHILGQQSYISGGQAAVRVVVTDSHNDSIAGASSLRIELQAKDQKPRILFSGMLNARGTAEAQFRFPAGLVGTYPLRYVVDTPIGSTEFTEQVRLENKASILLTTEKPLYQPGQTIHVRALALDRSNHEASAGRALTFELEDSRGNKVFKKATQTDKFGIASAEFSLADEVNLGTYHLRALMESNTAEVALNVERYVLPKFKVAVEFGDQGKQAKRGYRPGDHVTGTVRANYFYGKPVDGAEITVKASGMDVARFETGAVEGKTDAAGVFHFDLKLPRYFAGKPLDHGAARVLVEATVKDTAGHAETRGEPITVSGSPLIVTAIPEGGTLAPNLENQVFILASYPDGTPAVATVRVHADGMADQVVTTDEGGVAVVRVKAGVEAAKLRVEANDKEGNRVSTSLELAARGGEDQILLRTEHAVYRAGDRIQLHVFSTKDRGTAYVDVIKEGQTVLTRDVDIVNGQAELSLTATPEMAGTLDFDAYLFGRDAQPIADHRLVFVEPADELKITATADAGVYKPGDDARIRFRVTNGRGEGVQAALGLQVVDEAVFALAEKQPGFAKVFFYLEQEAMKPRYEVHSLGMSDIVVPVRKTEAGERDLAARALFSATEMVNTNRFETEQGRAAPQEKLDDYQKRYQSRFLAQLRKLSPEELIKSGGSTVHDAWGNSLRVAPANYYGYGREHKYYTVRSAGPDKQFGTSDDLAAYLDVHSTKVVMHPATGKIDVKVEHDRGPFNGRAAVTGTVLDESGATVPQATIRVIDMSSGKIWSTETNDSGEFEVAGLPPGDYEVGVSGDGFAKSTDEIALRARDLAVVSVTLTVGSAMEVVTIDGQIRPDPPPQLLARAAGLRFEGRGMPKAKDERAAYRDTEVSATSAGGLTTVNVEPAAPRVRSYFPEALYINPEIITDQNGNASIAIPLADSITTWRMAMLASTTRGALGSATASLKVFQDFFVDLDLPVTLTQGDRVSIPVAAYNYSGSGGTVDLKLHEDDWFSLADPSADKTVRVESGRVEGSQFTIEARRIGKFKLTLEARMSGSDRADIVVREIEVVPNGRERSQVFNGRLETAINHEVNFPENSIPDASKIIVRLYPGPLSQVVEGMDAILQMPYGCFEQASSATYPNVLALDYMKRTNKLTPEVHAKAEGFIANGYQRLLTFEVAGGGFSWFGSAPANKILTAYGLMEFSDMSKVHDVDPQLIARTEQWLASQQQADGSWKPDTNFINEGATNRYNSDALRITAYIAWSLESAGFGGPAVERAKEFVASHLGAHGGTRADAYTLAVIANFAVDYKRDRAFTREAMQALLDARKEKDEQMWWTSEETGLYATGSSAAVETTGLAVQALLKWGEASETARKALSYLEAKKDSNGTWGSTQATIMALRALLLSTEKGGGGDVHGAVEVSLNGKTVEKLALTNENNDLLHQFVIPVADANRVNDVAIRFDGKGGLAYQVVGRYFVPWTEKPEGEPLSIDVAYDRTRLAQDDIATATATVRNNLHKAANMVMIDLGIPPGFDLLTEDLQAYQEKSAGRKSGRLEKFNLTATQAILYFDSIAAGDTVKLSFRLQAKYPIRAKTFESRVYEYYDPDVHAEARPVQLEVRGR